MAEQSDSLISKCRDTLAVAWKEVYETAGKNPALTYIADSKLKDLIHSCVNTQTKTYRYVLPTQHVNNPLRVPEVTKQHRKRQKDKRGWDALCSVLEKVETKQDPGSTVRVFKEIVKQQFVSGQNIYIFNILDFASSLLALLGETGRREFLENVAKTLDTYGSAIEHRRAWADLLSQI